MSSYITTSKLTTNQAAQMTESEAAKLSPQYRRQFGFDAWLDASIELWKSRCAGANTTLAAATWDMAGSNVK